MHSLCQCNHNFGMAFHFFLPYIHFVWIGIKFGLSEMRMPTIVIHCRATITCNSCFRVWQFCLVLLAVQILEYCSHWSTQLLYCIKQARSFAQVYIGTSVYLWGEQMYRLSKPKQQLYYYSKQSMCTKTIKNRHCCTGSVDIKVLLFVCLHVD